MLELLSRPIGPKCSMEEVVTAEEIRSIIGVDEQITPDKKSDVAKRYRLPKGGEVGVIFKHSSQSPFVANCRDPSAPAYLHFRHCDGRLFTCLFSSRPLNQLTDLLTMMRAGLTDKELVKAIETTWINREDRYSEIRSEQASASNRIEMSYIGG